MKISIGADHGGAYLRTATIEYLTNAGHQVIDHGTSTRESVDYPDYALDVCNDVISHRADAGILICSTGQGMNITANKIKGIRSILAFNEDSVEFTRLHNNANVICFAGKYHTPYMAEKMIEIFLKTDFEGGERHTRRLNKIAKEENS